MKAHHAESWRAATFSYILNNGVLYPDYAKSRNVGHKVVKMKAKHQLSKAMIQQEQCAVASKKIGTKSQKKSPEKKTQLAPKPGAKTFDSWTGAASRDDESTPRPIQYLRISKRKKGGPARPGPAGRCLIPSPFRRFSSSFAPLSGAAKKVTGWVAPTWLVHGLLL